MKQQLLIIALSLLMYSGIWAQTEEVASGSGTENDPYLISNPDNLYWLSQNSDNWASGTYFEQTANIDASDTENWHSGYGFSSIGNSTNSFQGEYNGGGFIISGLYINRSTGQNVGLFGYVAGASVSNLGMVNVDITGSQYVGGLVGYQTSSSSVSNCYSSGEITGASSGGLVGYNRSSSSVSNCYSSAKVTGSSTGGLVGYNIYSATITNSYSSGAVTKTSDYNGGLVGRDLSSTIITSSYFNTTTSHQTEGIGYNANSQVVTGLTSDEMQTKTSFSDWDFSSVWDMNEGVSFPLLRDVYNAPILLMTNQVAQTGEAFSYTVSVVMDNQTLSYTLDESEDGMSISSDGELSWTPSTTGEYTVELTATDGNGVATSGSFIIAVVPFDGSGTSEDPYLISSLDELEILSETVTIWEKSFEQTADIDASETSSWDSGSGFSPIGNSTNNFYGEYNGGGYTISNLYINRSGENYIALFGYANDALIEKLGIVDVNITGSNYVAALMGRNVGATVNYCYSSGTITGSDYTGGLVAHLYYTSNAINNCYSSAMVTGSGDYVGGLVSYSRVADITNCYSCGLVSGSGDFVGGLVGYNTSSSDIISCYYNTESSEQSKAIGTDQENETVIGLTTSEMKQSSNFSSWDFSSIWEIDEDLTFPRLVDVYDAPILLMADRVTKSDEAYSTYAAVPMDNQTLTCSLDQSEDGMVISSYGEFTWTPSTVGDYTVELTVTDGNGYSLSDGFAIAVVPFDGSGTSDDPFLISSLYELGVLSEITSIWDYYYEQTADIDASETSSWNSGEGFSPIGNGTNSFEGQYNGSDYTISDLYINRSSESYIGLFGYTYYATIYSLSIIDADITGVSFMGGLVGSNAYSSLSNCNSSGIITGSGNSIGGLVGYNNESTVSYCHSSGDVTGANSYTGGLVGHNLSSISNCYSSANVTATNYVGGLTGRNYTYGEITNSYCCGVVTATGSSISYAGSFVGVNYGTVSSSYFNTTTSGQTDDIGTDNNSQTVTGISTDEMKTESSFDSWDFTVTTGNWEITDGTTFPRLQNVEDEPIVFAMDDETIIAGQAFSCELDIIQMDNEIASYTFNTSTEGMAISDGTFTWTPDEDITAGDYEVDFTVTDTEGLFCSSSFTLTVTIATDINVESDESISIYPNPASTTISVEGSNGVAYLFNLAGNKVLTQDLSQSNSVNISDLTKGIYILKVDGEIVKVVKK